MTIYHLHVYGHTIQARRNGLTLMEVLAAIFVMGIGLLSIMGMFPMAAITMERAISYDHAAHAVSTAKAMGIAMNIRFDPALTDPATNISYFTNPYLGGPLNAPFDGPSYAVFVDPVGYLCYSASYSDWIAGAGQSTIRRRPASFATTPVGMLKNCVLLDDINFAGNGKADTSSGSVFRDYGVSYAWLLQRPKAGDATCCNMTVVVFNQRPLTTGLRLNGREFAYPKCTVNFNTNPGVGGAKITTTYLMDSLTITWTPGMPVPPVKPGSYVLDATPGISQSTHLAQAGPGMATFYRVTDVGDVVGNSVSIDLAQPLLPAFQTDGVTPLVRTLIVMEGVAEVLDCGTSWKTGGN